MAKKLITEKVRFLKKTRPHILAFLFFLIPTALVTFPLLVSPTDRITGLGDELLVTWIMNWNFHALLTDPLAIFQANIFYPYANTLAYSDIFFTSTLIGLISYLLMQEPVIFFNANLVFSLLTLSFFTYLLVYYLTKNYFASVISGMLIAFSTFTLTKIAILQLISIQWIPLSLLFFILYLRKKRFLYFVLTCLFFLIQVYNSFLPGYFLVLCYLVIVSVFLLKREISLSLFFNPKILFTVFITFLLTFPIILPYYAVSKEFSYVRDIRDTIHFANRPEYTFYPSSKTRLQEEILAALYAHDKGPYKYDGYLGFVFFLLLFFIPVYLFILRKKTLNIEFTVFSIISISAFVLSLGPVLQWGGSVIKEPFIIPLPYAVLYYLVPGFNGLRNSGRWEMLAIFAFSVIIGITLASLFKRKSLIMQSVASALLSLLIIIEYPFPLHTESIARKEDFPPVYAFITRLPRDVAIIELPLYSWNMTPYSMEEFKREYYSTLHFRKTVNGYSGFSPPAWEEQARDVMLTFPDEKTLASLKTQGVDYFILHKEQYDKLERENFHIAGEPVRSWNVILPMLKKRQDIEFVTRVNNNFIYKFK